MKWLADECFDNDIVHGLLRRSPAIDLIRAQDVAEIAGMDDRKLSAHSCRTYAVTSPASTRDVLVTIGRLSFTLEKGEGELGL